MSSTSTSDNPYLAHMKSPANPPSTADMDVERLEEGPKNFFTGRPLSTKYFDILEGRRKLPVHKQRHEFLKLVRNNQITLLVGETGSGKTTQYVQLIMLLR